MRTLLLIAILTSTASAQQFRVHVQPQFRVIVKSSTAVAVDPIRTTDSAPAVEGITVTPEKLKEVIQSDGYTLVFCTASWCGPCRSFKASPEYARIRGRMTVEIADIDKFPAWKRYARRVPTFWLIRKSDRARLKSWEGAITLTQIEAEIRVQGVPKAAVMTHREMVELHNRLQNQASGLNTTWTFPGDIRTHLRTVHGVAL